MARQETILSAFVASPSDVADERTLLEEIVRELNLTWSRQLGVRIELIKWETHTYPSVGTHPQEVINQQVGDDYDIFIGIMWARFGSPTIQHESGTEEEFERAFGRRQRDPDSVRIMFYFKDAPLAPSKVDPRQLQKVGDFKSKLGGQGTYHWTFTERDQFRSYLRLHLSRVIQAWQKEEPPGEKRVAGASASITPQPAELEALEEPGFLDMMEASMEATALSTNSMEKITAATNDVGVAIQSRADELNEAKLPDGTFDLRVAKRISNKAAQDLEVFVARIEPEIPIFAKAYRSAVEELGKAANLGAEDFGGNAEPIQSLRDALLIHQVKLPEAASKTLELRNAIAGSPRTTSQFNKAKRRAVQVLDGMLAEMESACQLNKDVLQLLDDILSGL